MTRAHFVSVHLSSLGELRSRFPRLPGWAFLKPHPQHGMGSGKMRSVVTAPQELQDISRILSGRSMSVPHSIRSQSILRHRRQRRGHTTLAVASQPHLCDPLFSWPPGLRSRWRMPKAV